jgi:hypothetical protein
MIATFRLISETTFDHGWRNDAKAMRFVTAPAQSGILGGEIELTITPGSIDDLQFGLGKSYSVEFRLLEEGPEAEIHEVGSGQRDASGQQDPQAEAA